MTNVTLMTAVAFMLFMSRGITGPVSSLYVESLGASYMAIGLLGTVTSLTAIVANYVWGRASDRLGQRRIFLLLGLATLAVSYGLMAIVPSYEVLFPLHVLGALAQAAYGTASLALMGDLLELRGGGRGRRMGTYRGLASLGFGLTALLSGSLADWLSIRVTFDVAAVLVAVAFFLALRIKEPSPSDRFAGTEGHAARSHSVFDAGGSEPSLRQAEDAAQMGPLGELSSSDRAKGQQPPGIETASASQPEGPGRLPLAPLLVSAFLWWLVTGAVYAVWANYMVGELGYGQAEMSRLWALASLSEFPLMILVGWLSDHVGRLPMLSLGFLAWTLVFLGYVFVPAMPWIALVQLLRGFAYSAFTATAMTYAAEVRSKSQRGRISGLYGSFGGVGSILGSAMGGALAQFCGFRIMIAANAALIFAGAVYLAAAAIRRSKTGVEFRSHLWYN
jgi:MFS family permease